MTPHHLSTVTLHRLRYGELDEVEESAVRQHLGSCERCTARLAVQEQERAAFVVRPVPPEIRALSSPPPEPRRGWWADLFPFLLAGAAATILFVGVPAIRGPDLRPPADRIAFRGALPEVEAWIDQGEGARPLRDEDVLEAGDRVQLTYDPRGAPYIAIAGRDGTGTVEVYTTAAPTGIGLVRAPFALTLDGAPGIQELFVVGSDGPLDESAVKTAVRSGVSGARVARLAIRKKEEVR